MNQQKLNTNAMQILVNRYSLRDEKGETVESPSEIFLRTARVVAEAENNYRNGLGIIEVREKFFELLYDMRFVPNGRTIANAGTGSGQLANCFVLPIEDDLGKGTNSIFEVLRKAIMTLQTGGGVGFNFGNIRPKGAKIGAGKGKATGAVSFIKVYDTAFWVIGQGGGRRSAAMAVLPVWHPDIFEFIKCKSEEGVITNFNISVGITDDFMEAVKKGTSYPLINPETEEVWKEVDARELFNEIVRYAHKNGEPGVLFLDAANRSNPVPNLYKLVATNPCGEQFLGPYENCCLGSVNLRKHVRKVRGGGYEVDWELLADTVNVATRFLDNVIDVNKYVATVPEIEEAAKRIRRIGISIMGLADMMYMVGVRYGSKDGQDFAGQIMEFVRYQSMKGSIELAKHRGPFPGIKGSIYDARDLKWKIKNPLVEKKRDYGRPKLDWKGLTSDLKKFGIRNGAQNTIAPTGSIATVSGLEGYGCEPVFALSYTRNTREGAEKVNKEWIKMEYESSLLEEALKREGLNKKERDEVFAKVRENGGTLDGVSVSKKLKETFVVSADLTVEEHVRMQAVLQRFVDNSISKTINFPADATMDEVAEAYMLGWELGLKGMTVYVEGSRQQVVLEKKPFEPNGNGSKNENICPECGGELRIEEGCATCPECAYSRCDK